MLIFTNFFYCAETSAEVSLVWQVPTSPDTSVSVCTCHMWHVYFSFLVLTRRCLRALPTLPVTTGSQVNSQSCSNVATATVYRGQTAYSDRIRNSAAKQYFFFLPNLEKNTFHDLRHSSETILANDSWLFIKKWDSNACIHSLLFKRNKNICFETCIRVFKTFSPTCATCFLSPSGP